MAGKGFSLVLILGNLVKDVDVKQASNGRDYADFQVSVTQPIKIGDRWQDDKTRIHNCRYFNISSGQAGVLTKGRQVWVQGRLDSYTDTTGKESTSVLVDMFRMTDYVPRGAAENDSQLYEEAAEQRRYIDELQKRNAELERENMRLESSRQAAPAPAKKLAPAKKAARR